MQLGLLKCGRGAPNDLIVSPSLRLVRRQGWGSWIKVALAEVGVISQVPTTHPPTAAGWGVSPVQKSTVEVGEEEGTGVERRSPRFSFRVDSSARVKTGREASGHREAACVGKHRVWIYGSRWRRSVRKKSRGRVRKNTRSVAGEGARLGSGEDRSREVRPASPKTHSAESHKEKNS